MGSSGKSKKLISALAVAAAATVSARMAHAVTLSLYYGSDTSYFNSNNGIFVGSGYDPTGTTPNITGGSQFLTGTVGGVPSFAGEPVTIYLPIGSYMSIAIDAVLTGNPNSAGGHRNPGDVFTQPSFLGLAGLGLSISSTDAHGTLLTPYSTDTQVETTTGGLPSYASTAQINNIDPTIGNAASALGTNNGGGYNAKPDWASFDAPGNVQPNLPGYDTAPNSVGGVGLGSTIPTGGAFPAGSNFSANGHSSAAALEAFAAQSNTASYDNATDFLDSLTFRGLAAGIVTLTPNIITQATEYWKPSGTVTVGGKVTTSYAANPLGAGDTIIPLPPLVVDVLEGPLIDHNQIACYSTSPNANFGPTIGILTVTGSNGTYTTAQITGLQGSIATVGAETFTPSTDEEIFAYDILVNGTQATATQLATLANEINFGDLANSGLYPSTGIAATTLSPVPDPFGSQYNLFLSASGLSGAFMGLNVSAGPDLVGYSFSAVAVTGVPEPMTLGLLMIGGIGLLTRRPPRGRKDEI